MPYQKSTLCAAVLALCAALAPAQVKMSGWATPNPAVSGQPITITLDSTQTLQLTSGCGINEIRQGSPTGPVVYSPFICPFILLYVFPGGGTSFTWDQTDNNNGGTQVSPGTYYFHFIYWDPYGVQGSAFFPVRIDDPAAPTQSPILSAAGHPAIGTSYQLDIDDPSEPFGTYILAASLTTDVGQSLGPIGHLALDNDVLYLLSIPPSNLVWQNSVGGLDMNGHTSAPTLLVPNAPIIQGLPIAFHGIVLGGSGLDLTNPLTRMIQ